ncbi:hypothetical protein BGZ60DRAFT_528392 [Tricladium varicosporioides]|nr:hypothetical protein BGZ60DRAFT_528392 [Hymenoscyphus varicosporioides]
MHLLQAIILGCQLAAALPLPAPSSVLGEGTQATKALLARDISLSISRGLQGREEPIAEAVEIAPPENIEAVPAEETLPEGGVEGGPVEGEPVEGEVVEGEQVEEEQAEGQEVEGQDIEGDAVEKEAIEPPVVEEVVAPKNSTVIGNITAVPEEVAGVSGDVAGKFGEAVILSGADAKADILYAKAATGALEVEYQNAAGHVLTVTENVNPAAPPTGFKALDPHSYQIVLADAATNITLEKAENVTLQKVNYILDMANAEVLAAGDIADAKIGKLCTEANAFVISDALGALKYEAAENKLSLEVDNMVGEWGIFVPEAEAKAIEGEAAHAKVKSPAVHEVAAEEVVKGHKVVAAEHAQDQADAHAEALKAHQIAAEEAQKLQEAAAVDHAKAEEEAAVKAEKVHEIAAEEALKTHEVVALEHAKVKEQAHEAAAAAHEVAPEKSVKVHEIPAGVEKSHEVAAVVEHPVKNVTVVLDKVHPVANKTAIPEDVKAVDEKAVGKGAEKAEEVDIVEEKAVEGEVVEEIAKEEIVEGKEVEQVVKEANVVDEKIVEGEVVKEVAKEEMVEGKEVEQAAEEQNLGGTAEVVEEAEGKDQGKSEAEGCKGKGNCGGSEGKSEATSEGKES